MERRRSPRMKVRLPLQVSEGSEYEGVTINLSITGARAREGHPEEFSSVTLKLELQVPVEDVLRFSM